MDEWNEEDQVNKYIEDKAFLRIVVIDSEGRSRMYISNEAYRQMGEPEFVKILTSKKQDVYRIKLVVCDKIQKNARPIRIVKSNIRLGGGPNMIKKHEMRFGYYVLGEDGIFTWKQT